MDEVNQRQRFEDWARSEGYDPSVRLALTCHPPKDGGYASAHLNKLWKCWQEAIASQQPQGVPEGFVLVPREPTEAMVDAGDKVIKSAAWSDSIWVEMIAAAPSPEAQS